MRSLHILCDLDGICADLATPWIADYNLLYADKLTLENFTSWDWHKFVKPECGEKLYDIIEQDGYFANLKPMPGAPEAIEALRSAGHEITIVSSPTKGRTSAGDKIAWSVRELGLKRQDVIMAHKKELVRGDVLIDDSPKNVQKWLKVNSSLAMSIAYPYNREKITHYEKFGSWTEPRRGWRQMTAFINYCLSNT